METFKGSVTGINKKTFDAVMSNSRIVQHVEFNKNAFSKTKMLSLVLGMPFTLKIGLNERGNPKVRLNLEVSK